MRFNLAVWVAALAVSPLYSASYVPGSYLPLIQGNTWRLDHGADSLTLTIASVSTVAGVKRASIHFANPWFPYDMLVRETSAGIELEGIQYTTATNKYPATAVMFGEGVSGQGWTSAWLTSQLASVSDTVVTGQGSFSGVRRYNVMLGSSIQTWYLAPRFGFVQFGTDYAYKLGASNVSPLSATAAGVSSTLPRTACPKVGIEANPAANGDFSAAGKAAAFQKTVTAGVNFQVIAASWAQLEPSPGRYDFSSVSSQLQLARTYGTEVAFTIKTIDTNSRALPADLNGYAWNDAILLQRWQNLVRAAAAAAGSPLKWLNMGNEVDIYLGAHPAEIAAYYTFLQTGARAVPSGISTGAIFAFDTYHLSDMVFRTLAPALQHVAFTYYPGNVLAPGGIGQRDPADVPFDMADMRNAAGTKPMLLTEIGYSTDSGVGGSNTLQKTFYGNLFAELSRAGGSVAGASFSFMSDIPSSTANSLAPAYSASAAWIGWFQHLGVFDGAGAAKPAWATFQTNATAFKAPNACTSR